MIKKIGMVLLLVFFIAAGVVFLIAHADENISGVVFADKAIQDIKTMDNLDSKKDVQKNSELGIKVYLIENIEFGKYKENYKTVIHEGKDIYANLHMIATPKGMKFRARWIFNGILMKEETKELSTDQKGVISYMLEGSKLEKGSYLFEVYYKDKRLYKKDFKVE